jgi:hypothetical protein
MMKKVKPKQILTSPIYFCVKKTYLAFRLSFGNRRIFQISRPDVFGTRTNKFVV